MNTEINTKTDTSRGFVASKKLSDLHISGIRQMNALAGPDTINLGLGQMMDLEAPRELLNAGINSFKNKELGYTENAGLLSLRKLIAGEHGLAPETVVVSSGAEHALYNVISVFVDNGDEVLIPEISYPAYEAIVKLNYGKVVHYKLNNELKIDLKDISSKISSRTKLVIINSPSNPCGVDYSELYGELSAIVEKHEQLHILGDEVYSRLYLDDTVPDSIIRHSKKAILVDSISKRACATGLRLGWSIAHEHISQEIVKMQQYVSTCAASISQHAAIPVLSGKCSDDEKRYRDTLKRNRDILIAGLSEIKDISFIKPSGGFYCFPDISKYGSSYDTSLRILKEANVLTIPGNAFGNAGEGHIRISFAVSTKKLETALSRIRQVLK